MQRINHCWLAALAAISIARFAPGQSAFPPETASIVIPLTRVASIRELPDGRLLVSGRGPGSQILLVDLSTKSVVPVELPLELVRSRTMPLLFAIAAETTAAVDVNANRVVLVASGRVVGTESSPITATGQSVIGYDTLGSVLTRTRRDSQPPGTGVDSTVVRVRSRRNAGVLATARLLLAPLRMSVDSANREQGYRPRVTLDVRAGGEQAILTPDGWVGVARVEPYRVDWVLPDGSTRHGTALSGACTANGANGDAGAGPFISASAVLNAPAPALLGLPDGRLMIQRNGAGPDAVETRDIIDRAGTCSGTVRLGPGESIAGVGTRGLYVVRAGRGTTLLSRHPVP